MRKIRITSLYILVVVLLITIACVPVLPAACEQESETIDYNSTNSLPWSTHTGEIDGDVSSIVDGNNTFSCDLYRQFIQSMEDENFMYSPYSIYLALAMAYAGARDDTARQMADTLHFNMAEEKVNPALNNLSNIINESQTINKYKNPDGSIKDVMEKFEMEIANAIWGQQGYSFLADYLAIVDEYYDGAFYEMDFIKTPERSRLEINNWIAEKTQNRIQDMISEGATDDLTGLIITNAIYFKARWYNDFPKNCTEDDYFYLLEGNSILVPMMSGGMKTGYYENADYQAVRLYYVGGCNMFIILPREGKFKSVEKAISGQLLNTTVNDMEFRRISLHMPKFSYYSSFYGLRDTLSELGMSDAFSPTRADFSGMASEELFIDDVAHTTFIAVDEEGTEAAAATVEIFEVTSSTTYEFTEFTVNRPFIYFIQHKETGTILFMGRVMNPAAN
jgi:serpin B